MKVYLVCCPNCGFSIWPVEADTREIAAIASVHCHRQERPDCNGEYLNVVERTAPGNDPWGLNNLERQ